MMKNISSLGRLAGLGAIAMIAAAGCGNGDANNETAKDVAGPVDQAVNAAGRAVDGAADTAGNAMSGAGNAIASGAKNADDALIQTPKVKAAILDNKAMKGATGLNVTSSDKNVTLTGTVKTTAQKSLAGAIAKKNSPGYTVVNNLKVVK